MPGRIPEAFIEELIGRTDIVEVIERRVPLKRAGAEFKACGPFHDEKTPSFTVSPKKQFYHCFGCGAHGTAVGFMMQYEGLEFPDAIEELARMAGMEVPREAARGPQPSKGLYELLEAVARFYAEQLKAHPPAIDYLKGRGLSGEICRDFGIGYAPDSWDALLKKFGGNAEKEKLLQRAGLLSQGKSGHYDKFRDRIMFPIHDRRGRVIAFGGRILDGDGPKYLNSPETELFHKGQELYGLYLARQRTGMLSRVIVVEGYTDVVALAQFGLRNAVATLGTATTPMQAEALFRAAEEVVYCFDGDEAGRKAAWRALESTLPKLRSGREVRFLFLPEGEDPDSLVRGQGVERFEELLGGAMPLSKFFFEHFAQQLDLGSMDGRARLVEEARPLIDGMPEGVFRDMMLARLEELAQHRLQAGPAPAPRRRPSPAQSMSRTPLRLALAHIVQNPSLAGDVEDLDELKGCELKGVDILCELLEFCAGRPNLNTAKLLELWYDHAALSHLEKLAGWPLPGDETQQAQEFRDALTGVRLQWVEAQLERMPRIVDQSKPEREKYLALQERRELLKGQLRGLES
ncbi:MAG: DNA primase [Xanthomonadales bacterium]|nr:DNA primase [Xanthomonadales bacterium]